MKNQAGAEDLWEVGEVDKKIKGGTQSGGNDIQGGDTGGTPLWLGYLGTFRGDRDDGGGDTHGVSEEDHGEAVTVEGR